MFRVLELTPVRKVFVNPKLGKRLQTLLVIGLFQVMTLDANGQEPYPSVPESQLKKTAIHSLMDGSKKKDLLTAG